MGYQAVAFDLLTALLDSWALWERVAPGRGVVWRRRYLELTYGAGAFVPYETLVANAAVDVGLSTGAADQLFERWDVVKPWPEAARILEAITARVPIAVVTNCSTELALRAVGRLDADISVVVTAEEVGWYKPDVRPYRAALTGLERNAESVLFVAGSVSDIGGAANAGMDVYWHNRRGLKRREVVPTYEDSSLDPLLELV